MTLYHGTSKEIWNDIQKEGILFGRRISPITGKELPRCTYLAVDKEEAACYGDVVLQVEYNPFEHPKMNNYMFGCWQVRVYEPISMKDIKLI